MTWDNTFVQDQTFDTFVRNTLDKYPFGVGVFQEWLANADDAKASQFKVALDIPANHYNDSVWGGPSILLFNNQVFSKSDWAGFTKKLGNSGKREDADSIGKFGLGSITFYHISDLISVVSGDQVLILDMQQQDKRLSNKSIKGSYLQDTSKLSHILDPIILQPFFQWDSKISFQGTIFRLPIRLAASGMKKKFITMPEMEAFLNQCVQQAPDQLHFLQNVESVEIFQNKGNTTRRLVRILIPIGPEVRARRQRAKMASDTIPCSNTSCINFECNVTVCYEKEKESTQLWRIFLGETRLTDSDKEKLVLSGNMLDKMVPRGSIAISLQPQSHKPMPIKGKGYCFLPILKEFAGLPIHVNGLFQLNDNRTDIWMTTDSDSRTRWNKFILEKVIAPVWAYALYRIASENQITDYARFYDLFPKTHLQHPWALIVSPTLSFFKHLPIFRLDSGQMLTAAEAFYSDDPKHDATYRMLARKCLLPYIEIPPTLLSALREASVNLNYLVPRNIQKLLVEDETRLYAVRALPTQDKVTLAQALQKIEFLRGLPLVPMLDGSFKIVGSNKERTFPWHKELVQKMFPDWSQIVDHSSDLYQRVDFLKLHCHPLDPAEISSRLHQRWKGSIREGKIDPDLAELIENRDSPLFKYTDEIGKDLLVLQLDNGQVCSAEYAKYHCVLIQQIYPNKDKIIRLLNEKFNLRICQRYPRALDNLVQACYAKNVVFASFNYISKGKQSFATLLEQCQQKELIHEMFQSPLDNLGMFSAARILQSQTGAFITPSEAIVLNDHEEWLPILGPIPTMPIDRALAEKLGAKRCSSSEFFMNYLVPNMASYELHVQDSIARCIVRKYESTWNPKIRDYLTTAPVVKVDNTKVRFVDLINNKPEIVAFFTNDFSVSVMPFAWTPLADKLPPFGFEPLPITKIVLRIAALEKDARLEQKVLTLLENQENFTDLARHRIFPVWQPTSPMFALGAIKSPHYFPLDEMDAPENAALVWTSRPLLHANVDIKKAITAGLRKQPTLNDVIKHFKNLVNLLHGSSYSKFFASDWDFAIFQVLECLTKVLRSQTLPEKVLRELRPLEFVRVTCGFVKASRLCFELQEDLENGAYFKVPASMEKFKPLLAALGAETGLGEKEEIELPSAPSDENKFAHTMLAQLSKTFDNPDSFVDVEFQVGRRSIYAHRLILSLHSPKFRAQFTGNFLDATQGTIIVIKEDLHTSYNALRFFLTYLYTGKLNFVLLESPDEWVNAVQLSSEHVLNDLKTHLERYILQSRQFITINTVCDLMSYAELFLMRHLAKYCRKYAAQSKRAIFALPEFAKLECHVVENLFGDEGVDMWVAIRTSDDGDIPTTPPTPEDSHNDYDLEPASSVSHIVCAPSSSATKIQSYAFIASNPPTHKPAPPSVPPSHTFSVQPHVSQGKGKKNKKKNHVLFTLG
eukprot:Phypoly_transcript_00435.p1 GENE.Phypoly_transcript_00435~~Phypoly_transcript_00435.p1  ORF type:complete len:1430 (+),score=182.12 Phypoly_transcript_00435:70-4359(+)